MKTFHVFKDSVPYDGQLKTAISVRDGVLEYLGAEINREPFNKVFRVYRSPATIANAAGLMQGIPLTNDHVSTDYPVTDPKGTVLTSKMIDIDLPEVNARLGVVNTLDITSETDAFLNANKRELSLGYTAALIDAAPDSGYDLEQVDIMPHHLAQVNAGRCGSICSFIDHKRTEGNTMTTKAKLHKAFLDADGAPSMTDIVAIAQALPEAIATLPVDKLTEMLPVLQEIVSAAGGKAPAAAADAAEDTVDGGEDTVEAGDEVPDKADTVPGGVANKVAVADSKEFKDALQIATAEAIKNHIAVVEKARGFLDSNYKFEGKTTNQVMLDAVAVEHGKTKFSDSELAIAFKMLKPSKSNYTNFGDGAAGGKFAAAADKSI